MVYVISEKLTKNSYSVITFNFQPVSDLIYDSPHCRRTVVSEENSMEMIRNNRERKRKINLHITNWSQ